MKIVDSILPNTNLRYNHRQQDLHGTSMIKTPDWNQLIAHIRKHQYTPLAVTIIFSIAILSTTWSLIDSFRTAPTQPAPQPVKIQPPLASISKLHLMGIYDAKTADIPTTQLQLTLQGTVIITSDPTQSRALIDSPGQPTKVYKVGDLVPGDAKIEKIGQHFVILNDNGELQKLSLPLHVLPNIKLSRD